MGGETIRSESGNTLNSSYISTAVGMELILVS